VPERRGALTGDTLSRRDFLKLAGVTLLGAGCGGSGGSRNLVFSMGPDTTGNLQELIERFNDQNGGDFRVHYRRMPADTGQYLERLRAELRTGGDIDVFGADVTWPAQFAANGWISDVSGRFPETERFEFLRSQISSLTYEGKVYGVPWFTDAGMLYYRNDLLEEGGFSEPPKTWEELKEMAARVKQDSGITFGFVFQGAQNEDGVCNGLEYVWTHGGEVLEPGEPLDVVIDSPESAAGLATHRSMVEDGVAPEVVIAFARADSRKAFLDGDAVFLRDWAYVYALAGDPEESAIEQERVGVAPLPAYGASGQGALGGKNMLINAASDGQDQAWEFVRFMTSPESQRFLAVKAALPPTRAALYEEVTSVPVIKRGSEALLNSRPRPVSPYYPDMSLKMAEQFNANLRGDISPEQVTTNLQSDLEDIAGQGT
jgi:trehalose/maltose transport system substrate-binding protein